MEIFFSDIPDEGLPISGKLAPNFFDLGKDDSIRVNNDIEYDLTLYAFEEVIVFSGNVSAPIELQCVTCLEYFPHQADFPSWQSEFDREDGEVKFDPRESLRDEIILALPTTPHCDEMLDDRECPKLDLLAKFEKTDDEEEEPPAEQPPSDVWGALDQLGKDDNPQ